MLTQSIESKFNAARLAQPAWREKSLRERADCIRRFRELLVRDSEILANLLTSEMGKPITQSRNELKGTLGRIDYFLQTVEATIAPERVYSEAGLDEIISYEPLGVIANISAWNYPYFVGCNVFIPALLCGNAVLYKPSEITSRTGLAIEERLIEAGVPSEVFACVSGDGSAGASLIEQPVDGIFFTGSFKTGKRIAETIAGRMIRVQMELGGKDPVYVCEDVDLESTVASVADGAFYNAGQSCCSVERIYVHESIYEAFIRLFKETVGGFVMGDPFDEKTYIGPLARPAQIPFLQNQIADAVSKGGRLILGGLSAGSGYFQPTIIADAHSRMAIMQEETFGPMIGIQKVSGDAEALSLMNDTEYGLTAGVYTRDRERARKLLDQVNSGTGYWNCCDRVSPRLPWSGRKNSGIGSTLSRIGILAFAQPKAFHMRGP